MTFNLIILCTRIDIGTLSFNVQPAMQTSYVVAKMLQASCGKNNTQQQKQTSPNHVQRNFHSSVNGSPNQKTTANLVNFVTF